MQGRGRRVAITGFGVVSPCGIGKEAYWAGLLGPGITGTKKAPVPDWDPSPYYASPKDARRADKVEQFAIASAIEEQGAATQEISRNVTQAAQGNQEVSRNIAGVNEAATQTGTAAGQVLQSADELSRNSEALRREVDSFLKEVRAA